MVYMCDSTKAKKMTMMTRRTLTHEGSQESRSKKMFMLMTSGLLKLEEC